MASTETKNITLSNPQDLCNQVMHAFANHGGPNKGSSAWNALEKETLGILSQPLAGKIAPQSEQGEEQSQRRTA